MQVYIASRSGLTLYPMISYHFKNGYIYINNEKMQAIHFYIKDLSNMQIKTNARKTYAKLGTCQNV